MDYHHYAAWTNSAALSPMGLRLKLWVERTYLGNLREALKQDCLKGVRLLEIGPGQGYFAAVATEAEVEYAAVDASPGLTEALSARGLRVQHATFPKEKVFPDESFDVVYLSHVLEHADTRADAVALINACRDRLRPGGIVMVNAPDILSLGTLFWANDYTHNFPTTLDRAYFLLSDCGLSPFYERRMVFGVQSWLPRKLVRLAFLLAPTSLLDAAVRRFRPNYRGKAGVYGGENFTIAARLEG